MMKTETVGNLTIHSLDDFEGAERSAYRYAMNSMADVVPVVMFKQGSRYHLSGALPYQFVAKLLYSTSASKKEASVERVSQTGNRPEDKKHTDDIVEYIKNNWREKYVLGSLTLNIRDPLTLFTARGFQMPVQLGYLLLPRTSTISITDGQHRHSAIRRVIDELPPEDAQPFSLQSIAVDVTNETELTQIHQDFADASKTKPLPPGLLAVYDTRNPANRVVVELEQRCALLKGRVDAASKTLSKKSPMLFTANQIRQFVKVFLTGSWQMGTAQFDKSAFELIGHDEAVFQEELDRAVAFLNVLTEHIPVWKEISMLKPGIAAGKVADLRAKGYLCLSAAGLVILAQIGHELFKNDVPDWRDYAKRLAELDWSKDGPLWVGNVISADKKILVHHNPVRVATKAVRTAIGIDRQEELEIA